MVAKRLIAYKADRYVIAVRTTTESRKLFQIVCALDGSLYVTFPYYKSGGGQMGEVTLEADRKYPGSLTVGDDFSVSTHYVKYSHHPSGYAQFSLTGKVQSSVRRKAAALSEASGHLFTFMVQGIGHFEARKRSEKVTSDRGFVEFGLDCDPSQSIKFVGFFYSEREFAARANFRSNMPWMMSVHPDGKMTMTLALATKFFHQGERWYLLLSAERVPQICPSQEVFMSLTAAFDPSPVALDHKVPTSFLMFIYPIDAKQIGLANIDL